MSETRKKFFEKRRSTMGEAYGNQYIGSEGSPKFYLKYRKLSMNYSKNLKLSKSKRKKSFVPDVLMEFEKRKVLPLRSGIVKYKGSPSEFNAK